MWSRINNRIVYEVQYHISSSVEKTLVKGPVVACKWWEEWGLPCDSLALTKLAT